MRCDIRSTNVKEAGAEVASHRCSIFWSQKALEMTGSYIRMENPRENMGQKDSLVSLTAIFIAILRPQERCRKVPGIS